MKYLLYHSCGLLIDNPVVFILRVFEITVRKVCAERLTRLSFCFEHSADFPAGVLGVELIEDIDERCHVVHKIILDTESGVFDEVLFKPYKCRQLVASERILREIRQTVINRNLTVFRRPLDEICQLRFVTGNLMYRRSRVFGSILRS